jgi:hypothetical protein
MRSSKNRKALIILAVILIPLCLYGVIYMGSNLYSVYQFKALPEVPTFAYSTSVDFATPVTSPTIGFALPTTSVPSTTISVSATPSITPLPFFTPTNLVYAGTPIRQNFAVIQPTAYRSPTLPPSPIPTSTNTLPPAPPPQKAGIACNNILYPVKPGTSWSYYIVGGNHAGTVNMNVLSVQGSFGNVLVSNTSTGAQSQVQVVCDNDIILSFPFLDAQTLLGDALNGSASVNYSGGVFAPNEAAFTANNWALSWTTQYVIFGSGSIDYQGNTFNIALTPSTVNMTCQTLASGNAAFETITVAAGTYNALKVICTGQGQVSGTANGSPITGTVNAQSTQWIAPNVGPVRIRADAANLTVFGIVIPLSSGGLGNIELQGFAPGP